MDDLFEREQRVLEDALKYAAEAECAKCANLAKEYGRLLKQLRRATKFSDKMTQTLKEDNHDLQDKVHFDVLTGIYSRRYLEENLERVIKSISRSGGELSVLMLDVDYFKLYNDTYGHSKGDVCLKIVAETITGSLSRAADFAARFGGEEFVVVLPDTNQSGAWMIAERILKNIRLKNIIHEKNQAADCVTISIGITTSKVTHTQNGKDYIKLADQALYKSKLNGRDQITYLDFGEK